jgi:hypothetical protein
MLTHLLQLYLCNITLKMAELLAETCWLTYYKQKHIINLKSKILDFKLSPCSACFILSFLGWFSHVWILCADVSEHSVCSIFVSRLIKKRLTKVEESVPKRRHTKFRRRGITQMEEYHKLLLLVVYTFYKSNLCTEFVTKYNNCVYDFLSTFTYTCVISGFGREINENCPLQGYHAASSSNSLSTVRDNPSVPSSRNPWIWEL